MKTRDNQDKLEKDSKEQLPEPDELPNEQAKEKQQWIEFKQILKKYQEKLGATQEELAKGLGISRQSLQSFLSKDKDSEDILLKARSPLALKRLWNYLIDTKNYETRKKELSVEEKKARKQLKEQGPDELLTSLGFSLSEEQYIQINKKGRKSQIWRIVSALDSYLISSTRFFKLAQEISYQILEFAKVPKTDKSLEPSLTIEELKNNIEKYLEESSIPQKFHEEIKIKFFKAIDKNHRYQSREKYSDSECLAMLLSIADKTLLKKTRTSDLRLTSFNFTVIKTINFQLPLFEQIACQAEELLGNRRNHNKLEIKPFIEVEIEIRYKSVEKEDNYILFHNRSVSTYIAALLKTIENGLGSCNELSLEQYYLSSLAVSVDSLTRCSIMLKKSEDFFYEGLWIEQDIILGIGQAFISAIEDWFHDLIDEPLNVYYHYKISAEIASLLNDLKLYTFHTGENQIWGNNTNVIENKFKQIIVKTEQLLKQIQNNYFFQEFQTIKITYIHCRALIELARLGNIKGSIVLVDETIKLFNSLVEERQIVRQLVPINILKEVEEDLTKLLKGKTEFWYDDWSKVETVFENLTSFLKYSNKDKQTDETKNLFNAYSKEIYFDVYLAASAVCASFGRLGFYGEDNYEKLEQCLNSLLLASYYSSRIGLKQRSARSLTLAARVGCRLRKEELTRVLIDLTEEIINESMSFGLNDDYKDTLKSELYLAQGELELLQANYEKALPLFLKALKGAIAEGYVRRGADSLYNLARASSTLDTHNIQSYKEELEKIRKECKGLTNIFALKVIELMDYILDNHLSDSWNAVQEKIKQTTLDIWNGWADSLSHRFAEPIESDTFLSFLSKH